MQSLKDLILAEHSKAQANLIVQIIEQKPALISELIDCVFANKEPLSRRAAWPLRLLNDKNHQLLEDKIDEIIKQIPNVKSFAVLRNLIAVLTNSEIPENRKTYLLDYSTAIILNPKSPIALVAHASDLFMNLASSEVILINELVLMLETISINSSAGIKAKLRQVKARAKSLNRI